MVKSNFSQLKKIWNTLFRNISFISDRTGSQKKVLNSTQLKLIRSRYSLTKKILHKHLSDREELRTKFLELQKSGFCAIYFINQYTEQGKVVPQESVRFLLAKFKKMEKEVRVQNKRSRLDFNLTNTHQTLTERNWEKYFFF